MELISSLLVIFNRMSAVCQRNILKCKLMSINLLIYSILLKSIAAQNVSFVPHLCYNIIKPKKCKEVVL